MFLFTGSALEDGHGPGQMGAHSPSQAPPVHRLLPRSRAVPSERVGADDFPAVALAELPALVVVHRAATLQERLDVATGGGRGVEKQDAGGLAAGVLPGMRDVAREERAGAGPADADIVADLEGDLAGEHP